MKSDLVRAIELYLQTRRSFGFGLIASGHILRSFARYVEETGHHGPLTVAVALQWARQPQHASRPYLSLRLQTVRLFAQFWQAYDPKTEVPPTGYFGTSSHRRAVHIYSQPELQQIFQCAARLHYPHPLRGQTLGALFALLACTGLRLGEALGLTDEDIDSAAGVLTIRHAKGGHTRLIPVHPSTVEALHRYRAVRDQSMVRSAPRLFVTCRGRRVPRCSVEYGFRQIRRELGWNQRPVPRVHDLRHTFAVRTLLAWYQSAQPIEPKLLTLSTYLGHQHPAYTYWYLTAVPELMELSQKRFAAAQTWASGGTPHE
jgi:integrase/recombinase XerD